MPKIKIVIAVYQGVSDVIVAMMKPVSEKFRNGKIFIPTIR
jgi:methanogenic corrinoid protein MtbC1